jgi:alpha-galactosidase/6-phospho-beta-glucosidase family protein
MSSEPTPELNNVVPEGSDVKTPLDGGRRKRKNGSRKNSWLAHVKATMKLHRNKSFKQVLKIAKKTYKRSQSQSQSSQSGGKRRRVKRGGNSQQQQQQEQEQKQQQGGNSQQQQEQKQQQGGSGMAGKAPFGESAAPVS